MSEEPENELPGRFPPESRERLHRLVDSLFGADGTDLTGTEEITQCALELVERKLAMTGTKSETRRTLKAILTTRINDVFAGFARGGQGCEPLGAEILIGTIVSGALLSDFADAIDHVILEGGAPRDYSFSGRADFISLEEVLQLLGGAKHRGCLSLEKPDNRLDIYLDNSTVAYFDPHRFIRRVMPSRELMHYREIKQELLEKAEQKHHSDGEPIISTLQAEGFIRKGELRDMMRQLGTEVLYEFLREQDNCVYTYKRLHDLPAFALEYNLRMPVTPILLEGNKQIDDWKSMLRVFPDPDASIEPGRDMVMAIGALDLGVLEIKMISHINGRSTPRELAAAMGLPLPQTYQFLVRFAKEGVVVPPGGEEQLDEVAMSVEESIEMAWEALDANDDEMALSTALDRALGFGDMAEEDEDEAPRRLRSVEESDD